MLRRLVCIASAIVIALTLSSFAQTDIYDNDPTNGTVDAWTINFGFIVSDTFTVSSGNSTITGLEFGAWLSPGDSIT